MQKLLMQKLLMLSLLLQSQLRSNSYQCIAGNCNPQNPPDESAAGFLLSEILHVKFKIFIKKP
jgi:hypothetical protein